MEGKLEEKNVALKFGLLKPSFVYLIEQLNNTRFDEENVKKKWHRNGFGRKWHSKVRT